MRLPPGPANSSERPCAEMAVRQHPARATECTCTEVPMRQHPAHARVPECSGARRARSALDFRGCDQKQLLHAEELGDHGVLIPCSQVVKGRVVTPKDMGSSYRAWMSSKSLRGGPREREHIRGAAGRPRLAESRRSRACFGWSCKKSARGGLGHTYRCRGRPQPTPVAATKHGVGCCDSSSASSLERTPLSAGLRETQTLASPRSIGFPSAGLASGSLSSLYHGYANACCPCAGAQAPLGCRRCSHSFRGAKVLATDLSPYPC